MTDLGALSLWVALLMAVWGAALSFAGGALGRDDLALSGARGLVASLVFVSIAAAALCWAFLTDDFALRLVATFSSEATSTPYKLAAAWAQRSGIALLFALAFGVCGVAATRQDRLRRRTAGHQGPDDIAPWVAGACALVLALVLVTSAVAWNPFARLEVVPEDGRGLDPRLQDLASALRIPALCFGYAAAAVAATFGFTAAARRRWDASSRRATGTWTLVAWCFLAASALLALRVAYSESDFSSAWIWEAGGAASTSDGLETGLAIAAGFAALLCGVIVNGGWRRTRAAARSALVTGAALLTSGLAAGASRSQQVVDLSEGAAVHLKDPFRRDWTFTSQGASRRERPDHFATAVALRVARGGASAQYIASEFREYYGRDDRERFAPHTTIGTSTSLLEDVDVTLVSVGEGRARVRIAFVPFVIWVWIGGVALVFGGALAIYPAPRPQGVT